MLTVPQHLVVEEELLGELLEERPVRVEHDLPQRVEVARTAHSRGELEAVRPGLRQVVDAVREKVALLVTGCNEVG